MSFEIEINSIDNPIIDKPEIWKIPKNLETFRAQLLAAIDDETSAQSSRLWATSRYALQKLEENWTHPSTNILSYWLKDLIYNVRSQIWCEKFDSVSPEVGAESRRQEAMERVKRLHQVFHEANHE